MRCIKIFSIKDISRNMQENQRFVRSKTFLFYGDLSTLSFGINIRKKSNKNVSVINWTIAYTYIFLHFWGSVLYKANFSRPFFYIFWLKKNQLICYHWKVKEARCKIALLYTSHYLGKNIKQDTQNFARRKFFYTLSKRCFLKHTHKITLNLREIHTANWIRIYLHLYTEQKLNVLIPK